MTSETANASHIRLDAAQHGDNLWRNNVGACIDDTGRVIRYGLCNESKQLNKMVKSSDYIGTTTVIITPEMVGKKVAIFTAIETKKSDWVYNPSDERIVAQEAFINIVRSAGGFSGFARSVEEYRSIIRKGLEWLKG